MTADHRSVAPGSPPTQSAVRQPARREPRITVNHTELLMPAGRDRIASNHSEVLLPRVAPDTSFNHTELLLLG